MKNGEDKEVVGHSPKGRRVVRSYQHSSVDGSGDFIVADKCKYHSDFGGHIHKIGEYLDEKWGLDVEYYEDLTGYFETGLFLSENYDSILQRVETEMEFEEEVSEMCTNTSIRSGCVPPTVHMRNEDWNWCFNAEEAEKLAQDRYGEGFHDISEERLTNLLKENRDNEDLIESQYPCEWVVDKAERHYNNSMSIPKDFIDEKVREFFGIKDPSGIELKEYYNEDGKLIENHPLRDLDKLEKAYVEARTEG